MATRLYDAATWSRAVRQQIEAIAATLMLGLQVFRERAMNPGGSLAALASSDAKDEKKILRLEAELELHRRRREELLSLDTPEDRLAILRMVCPRRRATLCIECLDSAPLDAVRDKI